MTEATDDDSEFTFMTMVWIIVWIVGSLLFVTLPFTGGIGTGILIFGLDEVREGVAGWIVWWALGSFVSMIIVSTIAEVFCQWNFPGNKLPKDVCSFAVGFLALFVCYFGFFYSWAASVVAAVISFGLFAVLLWIMKKFPAPKLPIS